MLTQRLYDLEAAGFIMSHRPLDKSPDTRLIRYFLCDSWMSFYHAFLKSRLSKIRLGTKTNQFATIRQTGAYRNWMGRAFELVCMRHGDRIAELLGFAGIDYEMGPWFRSAKQSTAGVQVDLMFLRKDNVITLCEMKRQLDPVGKNIVAEVERKAAIVQSAFPKHSIQRVLILDGTVSREVRQSGYFYKVISANEI